jgi:hypothetical protein
MSNTLNRLDDDPGGAREYLAELIIARATNAQMADAFKTKFGTSVTERSVSTWRNHDAKLLAIVDRLERGDEPADADVADAANAALKRMLLDEPERLTPDQVLRIKRELGGSSPIKSAAAMVLDNTPTIDPAVMDYLFFTLGCDFGDESDQFAEVCGNDGATIEDIFAAIPKAADVDQIMADAEKNILASAADPYAL